MSGRKPQREILLNLDETTELSTAIRNGDMATIDRYNKLIAVRKAALAKRTATARQAKRDERSRNLAVAAVLVIACVAVVLVIRGKSTEKDSKPATQSVPATPVPCDGHTAQGSIGDLEPGGTGFTTPWAIEKDPKGYWLNPQGIADGPPVGTIHVCVRRTAKGYEAWISEAEELHNQPAHQRGWLPVVVHRSG